MTLKHITFGKHILCYNFSSHIWQYAFNNIKSLTNHIWQYCLMSLMLSSDLARKLGDDECFIPSMLSLGCGGAFTDHHVFYRGWVWYELNGECSGSSNISGGFGFDACRYAAWPWLSLIRFSLCNVRPSGVTTVMVVSILDYVL